MMIGRQQSQQKITLIRSLEMFLQNKGATKMQENENMSQFSYPLRIGQNRHLEIQSKITFDKNWEFCFLMKHPAQKNMQSQINMMKIVNQFNIRGKSKKSKISYDQKLSIYKFSILLDQTIVHDSESQHYNMVCTQLTDLESDLINFIQQTEKNKEISPKRTLQKINKNIQNLKKIIDNAIKSHEGSKFPELPQFKVKESSINPRITLKSQSELSQHQSIQIYQQMYLRAEQDKSKNNTAKNNRKILQKIKILQKTIDQNWNNENGSFGNIKKWAAQYIVTFESIYQDVNQTAECELQNIFIVGQLIEKTVRNHTNKHAMQSFNTEVAVLKYLRNHNQQTIASYYFKDIIKNDNDPIKSIFLDYYPFTLQSAALKTHQILKVGRMLTKSLYFLQKYYVTHRDLKPHNILVSNSGCPKVIDFGSSFICQQDRDNSQISATLRTTRKYNLTAQDASNMLLNITNFDTHPNFDIYAFGIILNELVMKGDANNNLGMIIKKHIDWIYYRCIELNPQNRPNAKSIFIYLTLLCKYWEIKRKQLS